MLYYYNELLVSGRLDDTFDLVHQQTRPKAFDYEFNTSEGIICKFKIFQQLCMYTVAQYSEEFFLQV